jgi:DNA primase
VLTPEAFVERCQQEYRGSPAEAYVRARGCYDEQQFGYAGAWAPGQWAERLVLPLLHPYHAELVTVTGRTIDAADSRQKYYMAQGTKKQRVIYGRPRPQRLSGPVVVVEGQLDVWALEALGIPAYAVLGATSAANANAPRCLITPWQAGLLRRITDTVIVWPDQDVFATTAPIWERDLQKSGLRVLRWSYPDAGGDPDTTAQRHGADLQAAYRRLL